VVLPNSIAASQVTINLSASQAHTPAPLAIVIRVGRETDTEAARQTALRAGRDVAGDSQVVGCFVTRMDTAGTTLELRVRSPPVAERDAVRSKLLEQLAQRFAATGLEGKEGRRASFT